MIPTCRGNLGKFTFLPLVLVVQLRKWGAWTRWAISAWPPTTLALHGWGESPRLYKRLCLRMMESTARGWPQTTFYESTKRDIVPGRTTAQRPGNTGDSDLINAIASCTVSFSIDTLWQPPQDSFCMWRQKIGRHFRGRKHGSCEAEPC